MVAGVYRMVYRSSLHAVKLFQLYKKDETKACLKETLKILVDFGRYSRNDRF